MTLPLLPAAERSMAWLNRAIGLVAALAVVAAGGVLSYGVVTRYLFRSATDWQDEVSVFLLVGATFLAAAGVQAARGHIGIEALAGMLPPALERARRRLADALSLAFCAFFCWKSWTLLHEAWSEGQVSSSSWAPPLSIPYGLMAVGMTLLTAQILLQLLGRR